METYWSREFPASGQGTIVFNLERATPFSLLVRPKQPPPLVLKNFESQEILLEIDKDAVYFKLNAKSTTKTLTEVYGKTKLARTVGIEQGCVTSYWLSYDASNMVLKYGKGYCMNETTIMEYSFLKDLTAEEQMRERERHHLLFGHGITRVIEQYDTMKHKDLVKLYAEKLKEGMTFGCERHSLIDLSDHCDDKMDQNEKAVVIATSMIDIEGKVDFHPNPLICNWPPMVLDSSKNTLFKLDSNEYTSSASLPASCKELYSNVVQENVYLDWSDDESETYMLSDAIRYSIESNKGILHQKLKEKMEQNGGRASLNEAYLRVTLGNAHGNSPGIPYVLEIWPKNHGSPIHNHGNSYAVINVLHGGLTISIYNKDVVSCEEPALMKLDVKEGDVTWITPNWYQTHKLWNHTNDYCATIQCYNYGEEDSTRCPHFHYISDSGSTGNFLPNSDFTFKEMRDKVMKEYSEYMSSFNSERIKSK